MSSFVVSLLFGIGAATFVWSKLSQSTGNARPTHIATVAGITGLVAFLFLLSLLKWVLHF